MRTAIAMLMVCALAFAPASAIAEEHADDRSYDVTVSDERAEIGMTHPVEDRSGETTVVLDTDRGELSGAFGFAEADGSERMALQLHQLVEYHDENEDGALEDEDEDEVVSAWNLANASANATGEPNGTVEWHALTERSVTSEDDVEGTQVQAVAEFPEQDPVAGVISELGQTENRTVTLNLTVFDQATTYQGTEVPASHVHVEWTVDNYPYVDEDSRLALVAGTNATGQLALPVAEDEGHQLSSTGQLAEHEVTLAADLAEQARVDGENSTVELGAVEADEDADVEDLVGLNYERGDGIRHELVLGAAVEPIEQSTIDSASDQVSAVPAPGALAALSLLGVVAVALKRR